MSKSRIYTLFGCLALAGYVWLGWNLVEWKAHTDTPTACLFKMITHVPCPACGTTRSLMLLSHGEIVQSLLTNPFGMLLAFLLVIVPAWMTVDILRRADSFLRWYIAIERVMKRNRWVSIPAIVLVATNWCWNIAKDL